MAKAQICICIMILVEAFRFSLRLTYSGTTRLAPPTASPTILRPTTIPVTFAAKACHNAPIMNATSAARIILLRPSLSANTPATGLAIRAKRLVQEVMRLLSSVVSSRERSKPIDTRVEEMTPVLREISDNPENVKKSLRTRSRTAGQICPQ